MDGGIGKIIRTNFFVSGGHRPYDFCCLAVARTRRTRAGFSQAREQMSTLVEEKPLAAPAAGFSRWPLSYFVSGSTLILMFLNAIFEP